MPSPTPLVIKFNAPMIDGNTLTLQWVGVSGTPLTDTYTFRTSPTLVRDVLIGADEFEQATNLANTITTAATANFIVTKIDNYVFISSRNTNNLVTAITSNLTGQIEINPIEIDEILCRSSRLIISTSPNPFDTAEYKIKIYEGDLFDDGSAQVRYNPIKQKVVSNQDNIFINVNNLFRNNLSSDVEEFISTSSFTASSISPENLSKWVHIEEELFLNGVSSDIKEKYYFVTDGYLYVDEDRGNRILMSGDKRYIHSGQPQKLYFITKDLTSVTISINGTSASNISILNNPNLSNDLYIQSINIPTTNVNRVDYSFTYGSLEPINMSFRVYNDCRFDSYYLVFKNKFGVLESFPTTLKSSKSLKIENKDYVRSIVDYNGNFNINNHTKKSYSNMGREEWTLNTNFLPEYMNIPLEELYLSEEVWLYNDELGIVPVNVIDKNLNYKTSINDKLIQYPIQIELSHQKIKNIT